MTINADIQKLEPGALVELFELDATAQSGDVLRFHGYTQLGSIWWQGLEYRGWPVQAEGFARTGDGQQPAPTFSVGNVDGSITALCLFLADMVGAKVYRRRTLGKYLDAKNYPTARVAANEQFGTGNGAQTQFQLSVGGKAVVQAIAVDAMFRQDWQGKQQLYPTARTNRVLRSQELDSASWSKLNVTVAANSTAAPDGTMTADRIVETAVAGSHYVQSAGILAVGVPATASVYFKAGERSRVYIQGSNSVANGGGVAWFDLAAGTVMGNNIVGSTATIVSVGNGWWRCTANFPGTAVAAQGVRFGLYSPSAGSVSYTGDGASGAYAWGAQVENIPGPAPTAYIPTAAAAVTTTDYTVGVTGVAQFAAPPAVGALLTWDGSGESIENAEADPDEQLPTELWYIEQKTSETSEAVTFELASALDFSGEQLPRRQIVANVCMWLTIGGYRGPNCGYTGTGYFDMNDNPVADPALDRCGGRLSSCKRRFGDNNPLPFGSFPAADLIRG